MTARALGVSAPEALFIRRIKQLRGSAECPASSDMILAAPSHTTNGNPVAIPPFRRLGVVLASNSSNSSNRESVDTSCKPCLPCSSCSISCSLDQGLLATRSGQFRDAQRTERFNGILKMNFNFKKSNPTQAVRKRQEEILLRQGIF